jgi:hypothetical protein
MIVRDEGGSWQAVAQPDHGDVCGAIARAWGNERFESPRSLDSLAIAARRHDDGWAIWERTPDLDLASGRPLNVFDVPIEIHLAFFRAMIAAVTDEDRYAGVLASMHAVGIYTKRYGTDPGLKLTFADAARDSIDAFVAERNGAHDALAAELGVGDAERLVDYKLLQVADRLCLYFCLNDLVDGTPAELGPAPVGYGGDDATLSIRPAGPWRITLDPYPFAEPVTQLVLPRRVLPKRDWASREEFAAAYREAPVEDRVIEVSDGAGRRPARPGP